MLPTRRSLLKATSCGFGYLALSALCQQSLQAESTDTLQPKVPPMRPTAKRVIFLCMSGGPAQLDMFDYKPQTGQKKHPGSVYPFQQRGESGLWISDLLPETSRHADKLCVINGMYADTGNHAQSFLQLHTGERLRSRPSMGAWINYGLGTENQNLPGFISLHTSKPSVFSSSFLPPIYEGTPIGVNGESMTTASISNIRGTQLTPAEKRRQLDFIQTLNREHAQQSPNSDKLEGVIESMELAFRMQSSAPALLDTSTESEETLQRYRVGKSLSVGTCKPSDFGRQCLLARRFAEAGVRFIELNHGSWDQHTDHRRDLEANCEMTDAPIAALLDDLEMRGLLEDTLVVWGGEFGRPGLTPDDGKNETGHNHRGFTFWLAGGGVKGGYAHGKTDETGSRAVEGQVHFRDLHATILHALGLQHDQLTFHHEGRDHRLTGPEGGKVVHELFA
ncbi:DUF1501 domain-containing protein [Blastopirellula sp. JC732]|uniref:DUF1501 domain-containing protein n=1 Tax=Blastopirellula sediminis TaxID=2894196 RepID=A0A9X1MMN1_9BACT|nr:DUF1501 domain-containing protein [Blastopirellula sediminis]MCC9607321.1 DUF1501 domain-containing protein [Blastopirellula sediminis]MCC9629386.1 DUF1501 domain-containing protein [Blastopirellula sediminis]